MKREDWHMGDDSWAEVEIYRLAHGKLPETKDDHFDKIADTGKALAVLADRIMSDEPPNRLNAAEVCLFASKLIQETMQPK